MKIYSLFAASALVLFTSRIQGAVYTGSPFAVADGNANGTWSQLVVPDEQPMFTDIRLALTLSGGYNSDLYAYLSHGGRMVPLLNRIGVSGINPLGWDGPGMDVVFDDAAAANIHEAGNGYITGVFRADGQPIDPLASAGSFSATGGSLTFSTAFTGIDPAGTWTLFVVDLVLGGGPVAVNAWSLEMTAVPEPGAGTLFLFAALVGAIRRELWHPAA